MTLREARIGQDCRVNAIDLKHDTSRRLEMLGLTKGTIIRLLNAKKGGAVIIRVRGTRFALGREIAEGIEVTVRG
ncbi:MAG: ferrous iron transport protein A [Clostridia bacterium]|nr:ferrous iron transport protein A [Clostridia bacterium]